MNNTIKIDSGRVEAEEFVAWLNENGHDAELTNSECDETGNTEELWNEYCNS